MLSHASPWWHGGGIGSVHHAVTHSPLFLSRSSQLKIGSYLKLRCRPLLRVAGALATGHVGVCSFVPGLFESCSRYVYGNFYHRYRYLFHPYLLPQRTRNESHQLQQQDAVDEEEVADYYGRRPLCFGFDGNPVD